MADPWYGAPVSEFTTPSDVRRFQGMQDLGFDIDNPLRELARHFFTYMGMAAPGRSPLGARAMSDAGWAMRTPSGITGGHPGSFHGVSARARLYPEVADSSVGLLARHRGAFLSPEDIGMMPPRAFTSEMGVRPLGLGTAEVMPWAGNANAIGPRGWWLETIRGGRD